jgi:hypothetical protein
MAILSRMSWSEVWGAGAAICIAAREMWGDGDDGVFGVVLAEGFCVCDISRSRSACEIAEMDYEVCTVRGEWE